MESETGFGHSEEANTIIRPVDLRSYIDKFYGYMTAPIVNVGDVTYTSRKIRFFNKEGLFVFLDQHANKSIMLHKVEAVYALIGSKLDHDLNYTVVEPYMEHYVMFTYAEVWWSF